MGQDLVRAQDRADKLEEAVIDLHDAAHEAEAFMQHKGGCAFIDKSEICDCGYAKALEDIGNARRAAQKVVR